MSKSKSATHNHLAERLSTLSRNVWWTWNPDAQQLFNELAPLTWRYSNHNAVDVLREVTQVELVARLNDAEFAKRVRNVLSEFEEYLDNKNTWAKRNAPKLKQPVAYFSAEFGIHESLPIYSGGLGILSGDHIRSASDIGIPFIGVGLFYRQGYFQRWWCLQLGCLVTILLTTIYPHRC